MWLNLEGASRCHLFQPCACSRISSEIRRGYSKLCVAEPWRSPRMEHDFFGQCVPTWLSHHEKAFPDMQPEPLLFQIIPIRSCPPLPYSSEEPGSILFITFFIWKGGLLLALPKAITSQAGTSIIPSACIILILLTIFLKFVNTFSKPYF